MNIKQSLNLLPDVADDRDYVFKSSLSKLPSTVDLRIHAENVENQKDTNSCVANATVSALEILLKRDNNFFNLSRLFLYYNLRRIHPELYEVDEGSYLRDGFKSVSNLGICSEKTWDFIESKVNTKPDEKSYEEALQHKVTRYERISGGYIIPTTKDALNRGYPVTIGILLGESFFSMSSKLQTQNYEGVQNDIAGAHAMTIVGYNDSLGGFIVENSWGHWWGDGGYFLLKYHVMLADCCDAWVCTEFATKPDIPVPEPTPEPEPVPEPVPEPIPVSWFTEFIRRVFEFLNGLLKSFGF